MSNKVKRYEYDDGGMIELSFGDYVLATDFDTLAQRLQEAERLLGSVISQFKFDQEIRGGIPTRWKDLLNESDAFLAGEGDKP